MKMSNLCQSCSMPLDSEAMMGTEKDGSRSHEYCTYCYQHGAFVNPDMNLQDMNKLVKEKMEEMHLAPGIIEVSLQTIPQLKRWRQ